MLSRWARSIRIRLTLGSGLRRAPAMPSDGVLALGEQGRLAVGGDLGQGVDGGAARRVVGGRGVGVDRDEQVGVEPAGDPVAVLEHQIAVVLAGHARPAPAPRRRARRAWRGASASVMSFSGRSVKGEAAPGSWPPWPGSITTSGGLAPRAGVTGGSGPCSSARSGSSAMVTPGPVRHGHERGARARKAPPANRAANPSPAHCRRARSMGPAKNHAVRRAGRSSRGKNARFPPRGGCSGRPQMLAASNRSPDGRDLNCAGFAPAL